MSFDLHFAAVFTTR